MEKIATITWIRTAADKTIVRYEFDLNGLASTRHRKFGCKIVPSPDPLNTRADQAQKLVLESQSQSGPSLLLLCYCAAHLFSGDIVSPHSSAIFVRHFISFIM